MPASRKKISRRPAKKASKRPVWTANRRPTAAELKELLGKARRSPKKTSKARRVKKSRSPKKTTKTRRVKKSRSPKKATKTRRVKKSRSPKKATKTRRVKKSRRSPKKTSKSRRAAKKTTKARRAIKKATRTVKRIAKKATSGGKNILANLEKAYFGGKKRRDSPSAVERRKNRPSPSDSATRFSVGHIARGNDGNMWEIKESANGVKRWSKIRE